jgi:hypothetical protein
MGGSYGWMTSEEATLLCRARSASIAADQSAGDELVTVVVVTRR